MRVGWVLTCVLLLAACGPRDLPVGERCESDGQCASGMCVMEPFLGATCKDPCGGNDANCSAGERASGNVAYCEPALVGE